MSKYMQDHERQVIETLIDDALAAGHVLTVFDGEENAIERSTDKAAILEEMCQTGEDSLIIETADGKRVGHAYMVYGNEPGVVICDSSVSPEMDALLARATALGDKLNAEA